MYEDWWVSGPSTQQAQSISAEESEAGLAEAGYSWGETLEPAVLAQAHLTNGMVACGSKSG